MAVHTFNRGLVRGSARECARASRKKFGLFGERRRGFKRSLLPSGASGWLKPARVASVTKLAAVRDLVEGRRLVLYEILERGTYEWFHNH